METIIIEENDGDRELHRRRYRQLFWPVVRATLAGLVLTVAAYALITNSGGNFPAVAWSAPLFGPLIFLYGIVVTRESTKWELTAKHIRKVGLPNSVVKWKQVTHWQCRKKSDALIFTFHMGWGRTRHHTFHISHNREHLEKLIHQCCGKGTGARSGAH